MKNWSEWPGCLVKITDNAGKQVEVPTLKCLEVVFYNLLAVIPAIAILALLVMFFIGGFKYLTSGGNPKTTTAAVNTMTYAVLGIVLMVLAYLIFLMIEKFTGVPVTHFVIPTLPSPTPTP